MCAIDHAHVMTGVMNRMYVSGVIDKCNILAKGGVIPHSIWLCVNISD